MKHWPQRALALAERLPRGRLQPRVLRDVDACPLEEPLAAACSGGADSVCLLLLLYTHFPERRRVIKVLHFNHHLRGEASSGDEAFVRELAGGLGLEFFAGEWMRDGETVNEIEARRARLGFFHETMQNLGVKRLFLGHQKDDIAETMLMRLARGGGAAGLAAPRPLQVFPGGTSHLRPLLGLPRKEIQKTLSSLGIPWREDASNREPVFTRNRMRLHVLPAWKKASGCEAAEGAARSREMLEEDNEALETWLDEMPPVHETGDLSPLRGKPAALWRRALRRWLAARGLEGAISRQAFENLLQSSRGGGTLKMSAGRELYINVSAGRLALEGGSAAPPDWPELAARPDASVFFPNGAILKIETVQLDPETCRRVLNGKVDANRQAYLRLCGATAAPALTVRRWREGDRCRPLGAPGAAKLQDIFVNRKIPARERRRLPVICFGGGILWVPGLPPAEAHKLRAGADTALVLTYIPV